jgi:uncharacterized protein YdeI (YjbR/CyaY-like superfamily)
MAASQCLTGPQRMKVILFKSSSDFRKWLEANSATARELWVSYHKKATGKPSMTWPESVDEALCFGWIDGLRKSIDETSYKIRFSPRRPRSIWSAVNTKRFQELAETGRVIPAGLKAFEARQENRSGIYSYEHRTERLPEPYETIFKRNKAAWKFFQSRPPGYRKTAGWWVVSAKKEETRLKRLGALIEDSAEGRTIGPLSPTKKSK